MATANGQEAPSFTIISPINGETVSSVEYTNDGELERTLREAQSSQEVWREVPLQERILIIKRGVDVLLSQKKKLSSELTQIIARFAPREIEGFAERANWLLEAAEAHFEPQVVQEDSKNLVQVVKEPLGVVLIIGAWNYPYLVVANTLIAALVCGNSVLIKHAPQTFPVGDRIRDAFLDAGLARGVLSSVKLENSRTENLVKNPAISYVSLVGSVSAGRAVRQAACTRDADFLPVGLELGGCDAAYVRHDANLESAAAGTADGAFFNSGQSCCGIQRVFVHCKVYERFVDLFLENAKREFIVGDPQSPKVTMGPLVSVGACESVRRAVDESGAKAVYAANVHSQIPTYPAYMQPTILLDAEPTSTVLCREIFGPVVSISRVASDEEAIERINDSAYGLTASIWTADREFVQLKAPYLKTGTVFANRCDVLSTKSSTSSYHRSCSALVRTQAFWDGLLLGKERL